ncbi:MAG: hypothetical protein WB676_22385 [Bryobacteraceae bacterium]
MPTRDSGGIAAAGNNRVIQQGLMSLALGGRYQVAEEMMQWKPSKWLTQARSRAWPGNEALGRQNAPCVVGGQKVPLQSWPVRDARQREVAQP